MFTPIKNFITYIQNAGGSGMFGAATTTTTTTTTNPQISAPTTKLVIAKSINTICKETPTLTISAKTTATTKFKEIKSKMEKEILTKKIIPTRAKEHIIEVALEADNNNICNMPLNTATTINNTNINTNFAIFNGDDDIELQIKSSIMVKPSVLLNGDKAEKLTTPSHNYNGLRHTRTIMRRPSISGPGPMLNNEHMKFIPPAGLGKIVDRDKIYKQNITTISSSDSSAMQASAVDEVRVTEATAACPAFEEALNESFESALEEDSFLEVSLPEIPNSEIIVLNCLECSSPTTTATPTDEPIALDNSISSLENCIDIKSFNGSLNSTDEINVENETAPVVPETDAAPVYWLNVEAGGADVCDNNNLSLDNGTPTTRQADKNEKNTKGNLLITTRHEHLEEGRSEGSDSGLGVEAAQITKFKEVQAPAPTVLTQHDLQAVPTATAPTTLCTSSNLPYDSTFTTHLNRRPLRSNLKRRHEVSELTQTGSSTDALHDSMGKRPKRTINFDTVKVYYFSRQQGFNCVPSAGGCTLGMSSQHHYIKTMTLAEHAAELRRAHRMQLQEINPRASSSDDSEESEEDFLSDGSGSDLDGETNGFLQPVTPKQRRALLKAAGVRKIDASEKIECRDIRNSREVCGCTCRDFCDPETCACSQAGIKCQVDRAMFPCGCSRDACGNIVGRVEFNPARVRTHFIHTIMRLEMENRQQQQPHVNNNNNNNHNNNTKNINTNSINNNNNSSKLNSYTHMSSSPAHYYNQQTQSNYSSGYGSPAYTNEHGSPTPANYYAAHEQPYMGGNAEMHRHHHQANSYQIDTLDAGLYATHNNMHGATPTYEDLTSDVATTPYGNNAHYNTTTSYAETVSARSTSPYGNCFMSQSNHNFTSERNPAPQQNNFNIAHATSSPICTFVCPPTNTGNSYVNHDIIGEGNTASFIDLSSPVANATRLSQINDMLQQNRHTTATLVSVSTPTCTSTDITNAFPISNVTDMHAVIAASPPSSPTSSTTISVEHDDTSNISVINNVEFQHNLINSKEISLDMLNSKEISSSSQSSSIIAVHKEQNIH